MHLSLISLLLQVALGLHMFQVDVLAVVSANVAVLVLGDQSGRATEADD